MIQKILLITHTEKRGYKIQTHDNQEIAVFVWPTREEAERQKNNLGRDYYSKIEKPIAKAWAEFYEYCTYKEVKFFSILLDESNDQYFYDLKATKLKEGQDFTFDTMDLIFRANKSFFSIEDEKEKKGYKGRLKKISETFEKFQKEKKSHGDKKCIYDEGVVSIYITTVYGERFDEYVKNQEKEMEPNKHRWSEVKNILNKKESIKIKEGYKAYLKFIVLNKKTGEPGLGEKTVKDYFDALNGDNLNFLLTKEARDQNINKISLYTIDNLSDFEIIKTKLKDNVSFKFLAWNDIYTSLQHYENFLRLKDILLNNNCKNNSEHEVPDVAHQTIYFGAPGTGKSYELNKLVEKSFCENYERVTFHPSYMYGHFVGTFKPFTKNETITYKYVPGILIKQLIKAYKKPNENFALVIEEINRANVSAVFGDIFQLLDRDENGDSQYLISTSEELQQYLQENINESELEQEVKDKLKPKFEKLYLPKNFYILATMNSADQGVMPLDSAFKRRWEFKYLSINKASDKNEKEFKNYEFEVKSTQEVNSTQEVKSKKYNWDEFRRAINNKLSNLHIPEDKLIGPYFISSKILKESITTPEKLTEVIKDKVLMYLYDDVTRAHRSELFREGTYKTYSKLCEEFDNDCLALFKNGLNIEDNEEKKKKKNKEENLNHEN
ncbi:AAA family ATPase [Mycoplasma cottewii]|uniref:AAA family ATPase n=1 Tax=Mycoplasma cottewii TaxID=51364 RepID=A0ABY5TWL2_9MOLU|nr:AAA family ATPase [Mycoplasma cottewii]UWD35075.1 AAA family ATPase [Mycoplasma cottewii]